MAVQFILINFAKFYSPSAAKEVNVSKEITGK